MKRKPSKKSTLTRHLERQNFKGAANLVREDIKRSGAMSQSASRIFQASIAKLREYPRREEFVASVRIDVQNAPTANGGDDIMAFNVGENIIVSYSYVANDSKHDRNELDWIGLFAVNNSKEVENENKKQQEQSAQFKTRMKQDRMAKDNVNQSLQRMHLSPERRKKNNTNNKSSVDSCLFVPPQTMNEKTLIARTTVPLGTNNGTLHISQDPAVCEGAVVPGKTYVLCYCLHGSFCSVGNVLPVRAQSVPVDLVVDVAGVSQDNVAHTSTNDMHVHCGNGLQVHYTYKYQHSFTRPSGDWLALYCTRGGANNVIPAARVSLEDMIKKKPVATYNLSSAVAGTVVVKNRPLFPGEYQLVLWQTAPAGDTIALTSSTTIHATLFDFVKQDHLNQQETKRELRIFLSSSLLGCAADVRGFKHQVLPSILRFADKRRVALSILDLHEEIDVQELAQDDGALVERVLKLQNVCHMVLYFISSKYGPVVQHLSEKVRRHAPWLTETTNSILGNGAGASLVDIEIVSGLLVPQCVRPHLRKSSIACIQDISYEAKDNNATTANNDVSGADPDIRNDMCIDNQQTRHDAMLNLQDRASNASNKMVVNYPEPASLFGPLEGYLLTMIGEKYPESTVPTHDDEIQIQMDAVVERLGTTRFLTKENKVFQTISTAIDNYIVNPAESVLPLSIVSEHAGCGKSSSIAKWVGLLNPATGPSAAPIGARTAIKTTIGGIPCFVLVTFVGTSQTCSSVVGVMWRVCAALKHHFGMQDTMPETFQDVRTAFQTWPARCFQASGRRVVLIFDDIENFEEIATFTPYARVKKDETLVGAHFVESIPLPLHRGVRIIATMVAHSKCFEACMGMNSEDTPWSWQHFRLSKSDVLDAEDTACNVAQLHSFNNKRITFKELHFIEQRSTNGDPISMHGLVSAITLIGINSLANNDNDDDGDDGDDDGNGNGDGDNPQHGTAVDTNAPLSFVPENLTADECTTWQLFQSMNQKHPRFELLMCLILCSSRGLMEHEIVECFKAVSQQDIQQVGKDWVDTKPLQAWLALRDVVQPYFASVVCGRWTIPSHHIRRVTSYMLPRQGFRFYASLLLHIVSNNTAVRRKAEEVPHLLWAMLQYNMDEGKLMRSQHQHHRQSTKKAKAKQQQLLMETILSPSILYQLVQRTHHPQLGLYIRAIDRSFTNIAIEACTAMNNALGTHPLEIKEQHISLTSQRRTRKKKKPTKKSMWLKHFDTHQLLSRRLKNLLGGSGVEKTKTKRKNNEHGNEEHGNEEHGNEEHGNEEHGNGRNIIDDNDVVITLPHRQVFAVGKLLQLFNLYEPSAELLRVSLLNNMKKTTFKPTTSNVLTLEEPAVAATTYKEWVRSRSLAWKRARIHSKNCDLNELATSSLKDLQDMREAHGLMMESFSLKENKLKHNLVLLLKESKRLMDRFALELKLGSEKTLERRSVLLVREKLPRNIQKKFAKEWPETRRRTKSTGQGVGSGSKSRRSVTKKNIEEPTMHNSSDENDGTFGEEEEEPFSLYMLC
jgi:hypothetical protein